MKAELRRVIAWASRNAVNLAIVSGPLILVGFPLVRGRVLIWGTPSMQFIPWWLEACRQLEQGQFPLWNSLSGLGAPLSANYQSAFFYPPNWLLLPAGFLGGAQGIALGFTFLAMLHLMWAGWGMAALLRRCGASGLGQAIGGMAFALSGFMLARLEFLSIVWTVSWLPWVVLFASRLAAPVRMHIPIRKFTFSTPLVGSIALMLLSGHAQMSWYGLMLTGVWVLAGVLRKPSRAWLWPLVNLGAAVLSGVLLASIQLLPTAEYLILSQRSSEYGYVEAMTYSFWPWRFLTLLVPDFFGNPGMGDYWGYASYWEDAVYIGMVPMILALSTIPGILSKVTSSGWSDRYLNRCLWLIVLASFILALGQNTPLFPFLYRNVPTFDMFQAPARYLVWAVFAFAILAAIGVERWNCPAGRGLYWLRLGTAGAFAVTLGAGLAWINLREVQLTFIRATALAGLWALGAGGLTLALPTFLRRGKRLLWSSLVVLWLTLDLCVANWWLNPFVDSSFYAGSEPSVSALKAGLNGRRVYMPARVEELLKFRRFFRAGDYRPVGDWRTLRAVLLPNLNLLDGIAAVNNFDPLVLERYAHWTEALERLSPTERDRWLETAGVGAVVAIDVPQPGGVRFDPLVPPARFQVYACPDWVAGDQEAMTGYTLAVNNPDRIFLEYPAERDADCEPTVLGQAETLSDLSGRIGLRTSFSTGGWVLVDESWHSGWRAAIDGAPVDILRANYLFMAIYIPAGGHEILLEYWPLSFTIGALLSILMLFLVLIVAFRRRKTLQLEEEAGLD